LAKFCFYRHRFTITRSGKIKEGEIYASKGFQLIKSRLSLDTVVSKQAEFDALMVLIPVKLKLKKSMKWLHF
jgi:hypothetical protein